MEELTKRLDTLERKNRWLTRTVMLMGIALVGLLAVGWKSPDGIVEAKEVRVGQVSIGDAGALQGCGLELWNKNGNLWLRDVDEKGCSTLFP